MSKVADKNKSVNTKEKKGTVKETSSNEQSKRDQKDQKSPKQEKDLKSLEKASKNVSKPTTPLKNERSFDNSMLDRSIDSKVSRGSKSRAYSKDRTAKRNKGIPYEERKKVKKDPKKEKKPLPLDQQSKT